MGRRESESGTAEVKRLLARDQPGLFAAIGELDWYSGSHRRWVDDLGISVGRRFLEVGCATGALTSYLADRGYTATGLDRSDDMIQRGRTDHPDLNLIVGDAMLLPYDDDAFDAVVAASVINVISDAGQVLSEMQRVTVPGGTVSVLVPSTDFTDTNFDDLVRTLGVTGFSEAALTKWHRGPPKMSTPHLESLFRGADLEPVYTSTYLDGMLLAVTATTRSAVR